MSINVIMNNLGRNQCVFGVQKVRKCWLKCQPVKHKSRHIGVPWPGKDVNMLLL